MNDEFGFPKGLCAVANPVFTGGIHLGKGLFIAFWDKYRVIAETITAIPLFRYSAMHFSYCGTNNLAVFSYDCRTVKIGFSVCVYLAHIF